MDRRWPKHPADFLSPPQVQKAPKEGVGGLSLRWWGLPTYAWRSASVGTLILPGASTTLPGMREVVGNRVRVEDPFSGGNHSPMLKSQDSYLPRVLEWD